MIPWWSEKADRVIDGRAWGREVGLGVFRSRKWSMEEETGREGGSKEGGREAVRHVKCGSAVCRMSYFGERDPHWVWRSPPTMVTACGWALDRARTSSAVVLYRVRECLSEPAGR